MTCRWSRATRRRTVAELLRRELAGDIEQGDRIAYGPIDLIVRSVDDEHAIVEVGLALEHARRSVPRLSVFESLGGIARSVRPWRERPGKNGAEPAVDATNSTTKPEPGKREPDV